MYFVEFFQLQTHLYVWNLLTFAYLFFSFNTLVNYNYFEIHLQCSLLMYLN